MCGLPHSAIRGLIQQINAYTRDLYTTTVLHTFIYLTAWTYSTRNNVFTRGMFVFAFIFKNIETNSFYRFHRHRRRFQLPFAIVLVAGCYMFVHSRVVIVVFSCSILLQPAKPADHPPRARPQLPWPKCYEKWTESHTSHTQTHTRARARSRTHRLEVNIKWRNIHLWLIETGCMTFSKAPTTVCIIQCLPKWTDVIRRFISLQITIIMSYLQRKHQKENA